MPVEQVQTLIIGGGQAGLVMSHRLKQRGLAHLVLERHRVAERWRTERWDGLRFQFPNWSVSLPEFSFDHTDPDGFAATGEIVAFIEAYAAFVAPPIRCGVAVTRLRRRDGAPGFVAETSDGVIEADNVVVATGPYQRAVGWIDIPVLDGHGEPVHRHGIAEVPGLYFLGLQWLSKMKSSFLSGVGDAAAVLADHIAARN